MTWSLSRLRVSEQCAARYNYRYNLKMQDFTMSPAAQRGTDMHAQIEQFVKGEIPALTGKLEFYHGFLSALKAHPVPIYSEHKIYLDKNWNLQGPENYWHISILDMFRKVEVSAQLWDWKSGKIYPDHEEQKELYAISVLSAYTEVEVVTSTFTYIDQGYNREKIYSRTGPWPKDKSIRTFDEAKEEWNDRVKKMESLTEFIPNPSWKCNTCSFSTRNGGPCPF